MTSYIPMNSVETHDIKEVSPFEGQLSGVKIASNGSAIWQFINDKGEVIGIWGCFAIDEVCNKVLERAMKNEVMMHIEFKGMQLLDNGREMKKVAVMLDTESAEWVAKQHTPPTPKQQELPNS